MAHPWVVAGVTVAPLTAFTLWLSGPTSALVLGTCLLLMVTARSLALRHRTERGYRARNVGLWRDRRRVAVALVWVPMIAVVVLF